MNMLIQRKASIEIKDIKVTKQPTKGVPQGGILSPTLWNFIIESLLKLFDNSPVYNQCYADDTSLLISGPDPNVIGDYMNSALKKVLKWGEENHLNFNPSKTIAIMFTNKRKWKLHRLILSK